MSASTETAALAGDAPVSAIAYLDGHRLDRALRAGIGRLLAERDYINRINVFPVADGDTGTNLALTMSSIVAALRARPSASAGKLLINVADAALDGARGNSGAIIAQFFQGLADRLGDLERLTTEDLAAALTLANEYAHDALEKPLEGTVLTVIGDIAAEARRLTESGSSDLGSLMQSLKVTAEKSVEATRSGLEAMRKADVVDAGAKGFSLLLEGIADFVASGSLRDIPEPAAIEIDNIMESVMDVGSTDIEFRFCTECMVTGDSINRRKLREALSELGNSMVLAGTRQKLKIHIHTDDPDQVFAIAGRQGTVSATKADDMRQQARTVRHAGIGAAVVTDSAADLPESAYETLGIHFVPLRVNFGERSYMDKVSMTPLEFFAELDRNDEFPRTSQPAPGDFRRVYEFLASHFEQVVSVSLTSAVSGTYQAAVSAADRVRGGGKVQVIDSRNVSVGQGLIAIYAGECAQAGMQGEELLDAVRQAVKDTYGFGLVADLTAAVRGGRIPGWQKWVADAFGLAPIFRTDREGRVSTRGVTRVRGDLPRALARHVSRNLDLAHTWRIAVGHAAQPREAERLAAMLDELIPQTESISVVEVSAALGVHGGAGTLVVAAQRYASPAA
ncbi:MAG: DegV family protein [Gammaproteobacteria bacterium]|nr:DegV family protein [Gammaproteobacteria bacterium]